MMLNALHNKSGTNSILSELDINPRIINVAQRAGCVNAWSILSTPQNELRQRTGLSGSDIEILISAVASHILPKKVISAWDIPHENKNEHHITTGCCQLDQFLGGGIPICEITEICGESGSGKTQLTLQLALHAQLSSDSGGLGKGVAYICTESQFPAVRLQQLISHMQEKYPQGPKSYTDHIFVHHVPDMDNLVDCVRYQLPMIVSQRQVGLVIIDSVAAVFRAEDGNEVNKTTVIQTLGYRLHQLASLHKVAVVTINQVAAAFTNKQLYGLNGKITPTLGLSWANLVTTRLMLSRTESFITSFQTGTSDKKSVCRQIKCRVRTLEVVYCPWLARKSTSYVVTHKGVEDIDLSSADIQMSYDI